MMAAVRLARRGLGVVWPNPSVGALVVQFDEHSNSKLVGRGVTSRPGSAHAEVNALRSAGDQAKGATVYVTLEPCSHFGRTPPCANALINAGVKRVVIGMKDPNPRVSGRGISMLEEAGVEVICGVAEEAAQALHAGFSKRITDLQPSVLLKLAVSQDGCIGLKSAGQVAISGPVSRSFVHGLRANHDAILVGVGTALADDPELTCRLPGLDERSPVRVVLDSQARLPLTSRLVQSASDVPLWLVVGNDADKDRIAALANAGVLIIRVPLEDGHINLQAALKALGTRGVTRLLVEGGREIATALLQENLVDEVCFLRGPATLGADGVTAFADRTVEDVIGDPDFEVMERKTSGEDDLLWLRHKAN